jgi:hypothetical protein
MKVQVMPDGTVRPIVEMDEAYWAKVYAGQIVGVVYACSPKHGDPDHMYNRENFVADISSFARALAKEMSKP